MPIPRRIEAAIDQAISGAQAGAAPPKLADALRYAVKPGGARVRPTISLSVAIACGDDDPGLSNAAAAAIELMHCASLVHDDMPCFDDAPIRRGKPSVHRAFGEHMAVLTGDSLIILAFETIARAGAENPAAALELVRILSCRSGMPFGICAGQGWESEKKIDLAAYHQAKTGALFMAATEMGAVAAGEPADAWVDLGAQIGEAFQVADDLRDALETEESLGKPVGQDERLGRPSAVTEFGVDGAIDRLKNILAGAISSIPACPGEAALAEMVRKTAERLTPVRPVVPGE